MFHEKQQIGNYTLIRKLGRGGFGEVWLAENEDELFAVKLPHKDQIDWKQITQEIGLWTLCGKHPNLMPLVGARNFNGQIAIISEYAPDGSLEDFLKAKGKLSVEEAVEMTIEILEGLQHLHESGIIHRDLKPANILLDGKNPRLTDFGISRIISAESLSETIAGTWAYMAPECFDGKRNVQTDIWAVGVILYRMLTGNLPFPQKEQTALIGSIIMSEPKQLTDEISAVVKDLLTKILSKQSPNRPNIFSLLSDLRNYIDDTKGFLKRFNQRKEILLNRVEVECESRIDIIETSELIPYWKGNKYGFCDAKKNILITPKYDSVEKFSEDLAVVKFNNRYRIIDKFETEIELCPNPKQLSLVDENGVRIIPPEYESVDSFSNGLARVKLDESWRFINKSNKEVILLNYGIDVQNFVDGLALVKSNGRYGFIDTFGREAIPIIYEQVDNYFDQIAGRTKFSIDGLLRVKLKGKGGYIDKTGKEIVPIIYECLSNFKEDLAIMKLNDKWGVVDKKGNEVVTAKYDSLFFQFNEGLARAVLNNNCGFINKIGEETIPLIYDYVWDFSEGLALVMLDERLSFIDKAGKKCFSVNYDGMEKFSEGRARFSVNEKWGYIDNTGNKIIPPKYQSAEHFDNGLAIVKLNEKYGLIDNLGNEIVSPFYHHIYPFYKGLAKVKLGYYYGFVNLQGEEVIPVKYSSADFEGDLIKVSLDFWQTKYYVGKDGTEYFEQ